MAKMTDRCSKCGFKIRGKNHEKGKHHLTGKRQFRPAKRSKK